MIATKYIFKLVRPISLIIILSALVATSIARPAHPQAIEGLTVGAALGLLGGGISNSIDNSTSHFFNRFDSSVANLRQHADGLLGNARHDLEAVMDKAVGELEGQERELWNYYYNSLTALEARASALIKQSEKTVILASNALAEPIPELLKNSKPSIYLVEIDPPLYEQSKERTIDLYGYALDTRPNTFTLNGSEGSLVLRTPNKISLRFSDVDISEEVQLRFDFSYPGFWSFLSSYFDKHMNLEPWNLPVTQNELGEVKLKYAQNEFPTKPRSQMFDGRCQRNWHGDSCWARNEKTLNRSNGYDIIVDSVKFTKSSNGFDANGIRVTKGDCREADKRTELLSVTAGSIRAIAEAKPDSGAGRRCHIVAQLTWSEQKTTPVKTTQYSASKQFYRSDQLVTFNVPYEGAEPVSVMFKESGASEFVELPFNHINSPFTYSNNQNFVAIGWRE